MLRTVIATATILALSATSAFAADVRVAHLSPGAPNVDVLAGLDDVTKSPIVSNLAYPSVTPYLSVPGATYFVDVVPAGGGPVLIDVNGLVIDNNTSYTVAAVNVPASIEPLVLVDDRTFAPGQAKFRVVHASPGSPNVDVFIDGVGLLPALTNLPFKSSSTYLTVPPGNYTARVRATGTTTDVFTAPLALDSERVYSAFAIGQLGSQTAPFGVLATVDAVPEPATWGLFGMASVAFAFAAWRRRRPART